MKTITVKVPIELVVPRKYFIEVELNDENSSLQVRELYSDDTPIGTVDRTIEIAAKIKPTLEIEKISEYELIAKFTGSEFEVISCLCNEFNLLATNFLPLPTPFVVKGP